MAGSVTVFEGTGFIGRHLVPLLLRSGATVRLAVRHPRRVQVTTELPQAAELIQADVLDDIAVGGAVAGTDAIVNLVGILTETTSQTYRGACCAYSSARVTAAPASARLQDRSGRDWGP